MPSPDETAAAIETEQAKGTLHGSALGAGAVLGLLVAAVIAGSIFLVIMLAGGAVIGALVFGLIALARDRVRTSPSGDRPPPTLGVDGGPHAQRAEAGGASPEPSSG